ncbi:MAG: CapA family protein [Clostridia bacterium]|nr:CapA family protein [Clostridia bacterium]
MKKHVFTKAAFLFILMLVMLSCSCVAEEKKEALSSTPYPITDTPKQTQDEPTVQPSESPEVTATQEIEQTKTAKLGFVGDIMIMESQVRHAKQADGGYDFTASFEPMRKLFRGVDLMCANLETPLAGERNGGYSAPAPTMPPVTEENPNPVKPFQTFNAPDELAYNLKDLGVDVLTTANNHCLDRGVKGLLRTIDVLEDAGLYSTGTYRDEADREKCLIIDVNGIKVGILAFSAAFNTHDKTLTASEQVHLSRFYDDNFTSGKIKKIRELGAEYVVVIPHCGIELSHVPENTHKKMFSQFIKWGADAVISSHPHVVQPIEFVKVTREGGEQVSAPVVYSLGNFISNMYPSPKNYGLYVSIEIEKDENGVVKTSGLTYVPVICMRQSTSVGLLHQTIPCYEDNSLIEAYEPLSRDEYRECEKCRREVSDICGSEYLYDE